VDEAGRWLHEPGHVVWIGLVEPQDQLLRRVQAQFGLHDLAIKDAGTAHQRPKLERYGDALFVVARTAQMVDGRIAFGETHLFVGRGYIVSVRHGASTSYASVRERCEAFPKTLGRVLNWVFRFGVGFGSWVVGGYGADRCDAMAFVTTSGTAFAECCRGSRAMSA